AADFNADGYADLAIGVPRATVGSAPGAGLVDILYGTSFTLTKYNSQTWTQDSPGIQDAANSNDAMSASVATGAFAGGPSQDLAIGVPLEDVNGAADGGAVNVLYGSLAFLTSAGNQL